MIVKIISILSTFRPPTRKELAEENSVLKGEIKDHESRLKELEILLRMEKVIMRIAVG